MTHAIDSFNCSRCATEIVDGAFGVLLDHGGPLVCGRCLSNAELNALVTKAEAAGSGDIAWLRERVDAELARRA